MEAEKRDRRKNREQDNDILQHVCAMCVVEYVDQQSASTATNELTDRPVNGVVID